MNTETDTLLPHHHHHQPQNDQQNNNDHNDQKMGYGGIISRVPPTIIEDDVSSSSTNSSQEVTVTVAVTAQTRQGRLLLAMTLLLLYIGLVISLLAANNFNQETVIERFYFLPFHMYEFWGSVYFALVEGYILLVADDSFFTMDPSSQSTLIHMLSINVVSTMTAASLFTLNPAIFEVTAHYIEYSSQLTVTLIDAYFMFLPRNGSKELRDRRKMGDNVPVSVQQGYFGLLLLADLAKFALYAGFIPTAISKERSSHYVEFTVEILNSLWAFMYIKDLYLQSLQSSSWQKNGNNSNSNSSSNNNNNKGGGVLIQ
ncbi:unnamed protein product [Cylindrotheca closterium]|uniref:Uncharacterized protein n=1 Tax=Cylindrotheca closterium TaxID=2856 RepID=A0AAD2PWQ5_9STRA|nr:unnamed protein product [Cylindrotheca closterium]